MHNSNSPLILGISSVHTPDRKTHVGVSTSHTTLTCKILEFTAEEGLCYAPYWVMKLLGIEEGDLVNLKRIMSLPKATAIKLSAKESTFLSITNPKAV